MIDLRSLAVVLAVAIGSLAGPSTLRAQETATPAATPPPEATAPVYLTIANSGCMPDQLIEATTDVAERVEIDETVKGDDTVETRPLPDGITLLAGRTTTLEPGGDHLLLIGLREELVAGDSFLLTLSFLYTGDVSVPVTVRDDDEPAANETPAAPVSIGTIKVTGAWTLVTGSPSGTPVAGPASSTVLDAGSRRDS
jgi:copper(I)-binding protein